ncbi:uncharacterized protein LOC123565043 isoform X2 [Mercenaria mercenaria]|uniref:uncharacterized protein LOC123565043 isoform X2 n=1 Tax=Mercenaria mercenaria TaxID=6596 RepID=UPI001E1DB813|nr:uncharacterized protein LOC123565043 isoform X2 [Mercenaria mercenaria]
MAGTAYHNEALRKQRLIERKSEAMRNLKESFGQHSIEAGIEQSKPSNLVFSEAGHYAQNRLSYYKIGPMRDQRQYDHSRDGPIVDRSKYSLKQEFNFLGNSLSMLKSDIVPEHKPTPVCRRY